jgi:glycosyltransferase involved in cell wall biosynthesis
LPLDWLATSADEVLGSARTIAELADRHGADLVQLHSPALAAAHFPVPVVAVAHSCVASWWEAVRGGGLPADFSWRTALAERGLHAATSVVGPTAAFAAVTQRIYGLPVTPFAVHNGRHALVMHRGNRQDFAFSAGRLWDEGKNVATLDRAAASLSVPIRLAGPLAGPHGARVQLDHASGFGVLTEGQLANVLAAQPIFVSAAKYEPFGLAALEAAMAGCALVLSDIATFRELWSDSAIFVEPDDDQRFAAAVRLLIDDPRERTRLAEAARKRSRRYTVERMCEQMLGLYRALLEPAEGRAAA